MNKAKEFLKYLQSRSYATRVKIVWGATIFTAALLFIFLGKLLFSPIFLAQNSEQKNNENYMSEQNFNLPKLSNGLFANLANLKDIFGSIKEVLNKEIKMDNEPSQNQEKENVGKEIYRFPVSY